jgi:hypothetical protein
MDAVLGRGVGFPDRDGTLSYTIGHFSRFLQVITNFLFV